MRVRCVCFLWLMLLFGRVEASLPSVPAPNHNPFVVASFNIYAWGPNLYERMSGMLQWFDETQVLSGVSALFVQESLAGPCGDSSAEDLAMRLGWDYYFEARPNEIEGLAFVYPPQVEVLDKSIYVIQAKYNESDYTRIALSMQIEDPLRGKVRLVNVHLAHEHFMAQTRKDQIAEILSWIEVKEQKAPSSLIVMGGDFNTDPDKDFYADEFALLENSTFHFTRSPSNGATFTWQEISSGLREHLDHFFVSKPLNVSGGPRLDSSSLMTQIYSYPTEQHLSDHNFLRATMSL